MAHSDIQFLSAGILIWILGSVASIITGQILAGNTGVIWIQKYSPNGYHLCEENMLNVYIAEEALCLIV